MQKEILKSVLISFWFIIICFPLVVLRVDYLDKTIQFRWINLFFIGFGGFFISLIWRYFLKKDNGVEKKIIKINLVELVSARLPNNFFYSPVVIFIFLIGLFILPFVLPNYHTSIIITALLYVILGLGLNIVVGLAGLLDLGYVAFYAIGGYTFALLNYYFGFGFWVSLPLSALLATIGGVLLGIPVLRLRGDYLAIVTLGFGEIIRLVLENFGVVTRGPSGVPNLPKPGFFGIDLDFNLSTIYLYFLMIIVVIIAIIVTKRLTYSKTGRAWTALREDEIACQAMGINTVKTKLTAFGLGAFWAGIAGAFFASKNSFIAPASFTFHESAIILSIVVLGGMGSVLGVILAALILVLLPEYLRFLDDYRMLIFGAVMVIMMVFKPEGLIKNVRKDYNLVK